ncbi:MAG TPA: MlaD family protein, partial [Solirubrobacteraceae bacterium]|nr:MlaD family protein [Solirubrobacteraceae bacterium]
MRFRSNNPIAANPVFLGALTVLVVSVAMFLAYNANNGLPFVPTYRIDAVVPDAAELVAGNDVDVGGARVGRVARVSAGFADGRPVAVLALVLDKTLEPLPADTLVTVRQRSNIGLKYVELRPGRARTPVPQDGTLPLRDAIPAVDLDQVLNTLDPRTRRAAADAVSALGVGLAGRGADLGEAFGNLPRIMGDLEVVGRTLAGPQADLRGFVDGAASAAAAIAPV